MEDEIAEFLTKTERKKTQNTQNILLDGCYLLFEGYLGKKKRKLIVDFLLNFGLSKLVNKNLKRF